MIFNIKTISLPIVFAVLFVPTGARAQGSGLPTFDAANYMQAVRELQHMQQLITKAEQEISRLDSQLEALTGPRGMGTLLNDLSQQNIRRFAPQKWQDTLEILNSGSNPGSLSELQGSYTQKHNMFQHIEGSDVNAAPAYKTNIETYDNARSAALGSMALSETSFNHNHGRITNYEQLLSEIDSALDAKAAADLANRIAIENGFTAAELIRLQATQIQLNAAQANQTIKYESDLYEFTRDDYHIQLNPITPQTRR